MLAVLAIALHFNVSLVPPGLTIHTHEVFHYYLGSKYSPEVGYQHLVWERSTGRSKGGLSRG